MNKMNKVVKYLIFSDGCNPLVYRVLDDHRRSVLYKPSLQHNSASMAASAYNTDLDHNSEDNTVSIVQDTELLCDDVLPFGWYRFLAYGM